jgi:hypothetical protein
MDAVRCARCGEVIGTYEPALLMLEDGAEVHGSLLTLRSRPEFKAPGTIAFHERCHRAAQHDQSEE